MASSFYEDGINIPSLELLEKTLGESYEIFDNIIKYLNETYSDINPQWKYYGKKYGWTLKVFLKKRNLFFITPQENYFNIAFVFGERAVEKIKDSELPEEIIESVVNAKKYAEGRGIKLEVKSNDLLESIKTLLAIKIQT